MSFTIITMAFLTACGSSSRNVVEFKIYAPSFKNVQSLESVEKKPETDTEMITKGYELHSPTKGQIPSEDAHIEDNQNQSEYSELIMYLDNGQYEEAIEYINHLKGGCELPR